MTPIFDPKGLTLEHIDPRDHPLIKGLENEFNEVLAEGSYNFGKCNKFVPYRVKDYPAPVNPGDIGEFLIGVDWHICEFFGEWWKTEAIKILRDFELQKSGQTTEFWSTELDEYVSRSGAHVICCSYDGKIGGLTLAKKTCKHGTTGKAGYVQDMIKTQSCCAKGHWEEINPDDKERRIRKRVETQRSNNPDHFVILGQKAAATNAERPRSWWWNPETDHQTMCHEYPGEGYLNRRRPGIVSR